MTTQLEIDADVYRALQDSFGEAALKDKLHYLLIAALESKLEKYHQEILRLEAKHGASFREFAEMWENGQIENRHSHEVESDYMDWEMYEAEKKELIVALRRMKQAAAQ
jgi:hypothetical protein